MKKTRKLLALVLAMAMAFSLMAVTAAAYGAEEHEHTHVCSEETIQPRVPAMLCPVCNEPMLSHVYREAGQWYVDFTCPYGHASYEKIPW